MAGKASEKQTGTRDETYNLVSVLYHALQGIETCEQYAQDAQKAGEADLVQFFRDCQDNHRSCAERAKNLLGSKFLGAHAGMEASGGRKGRKDTARTATNANIPSGGRQGDDCVDEQSKESFPASDPPTNY